MQHDCPKIFVFVVLLLGLALASGVSAAPSGFDVSPDWIQFQASPTPTVTPVVTSQPVVTAAPVVTVKPTSSPTIPELNLPILFVLFALPFVVLSVLKYRKLKLRSCLIVGVLLAACVLPLASAGVSDDWDISPDFEGGDEPFNPTPTPGKYDLSVDAVFANVYIAIGLIGVSLILIACFVIVKVGDGEGSAAGALFGVSLLVVGLVVLVAGFAIVSGFERSLLTAIFV